MIDGDDIYTQKLFGFVAERDEGIGLVVKIIGYFDDNEDLVTNYALIHTAFANGELVVNESSYELVADKIGRFIECYCYNKYCVDNNYSRPVKLVGCVRIITCQGFDDITQDCIVENDLDALKPILPSVSQDFLVRGKENSPIVIGLFRFDSKLGKIVPKYGKSVKMYALPRNSSDMFNYKKEEYLFLSSLKGLSIEGEIECFTDKGLFDWFKGYLPSIARAKQTLDKKEINDLLNSLEIDDEAICNRLKALNRRIEMLEFEFDEIKEYLASDSPLFQKLKGEFVRMEDRFYDSWVETNADELNDLEEEKARIKQSIIALTEEEDALRRKIQEMPKELDSEIIDKQQRISTLETEILKLDEEKEKLGTEIQEAAQRNTVSVSYSTMTLVVFAKKGEHFDDLGLTFEQSFTANTQGNKYSEVAYCSEFFNKRAAFVPCASYAYAFARGVGNSKLYTINVEYDWNHFRDYLENGLLDALNSCYCNPEINHVVLFESMNLAQPECGLSPLFNAMDGISLIIPALNKPFPDNLKVFATIKQSHCESPIGLPLNKETYRNWEFVGNPMSHLELPKEYLDDSRMQWYAKPEDLTAKLSSDGGDHRGRAAYLGY